MADKYRKGPPNFLIQSKFPIEGVFFWGGGEGMGMKQEKLIKTSDLQAIVKI